MTTRAEPLHANALNAGRRSLGAIFLVILLLGLLLRMYVAWVMHPLNGDPMYSYAYRAELIASGVWDGVFLMWHPPGYPLILAGTTSLIGRAAGAIECGVAISLICYVLLFVIVDQLVRRCVCSSGARIAAAAFVAFQENLIQWQAAPVTEPPYLVLVYGAILVLLNDRLRILGSALAGLMLGVATTLRFDALAPLIGIVVIHAGRELLARNDAPRRPLLGQTAAIVTGAIVASGWMWIQWDYLASSRAIQQTAYTVADRGTGGQLMRWVQGTYFAFTQWLPQVLLLPFWIVAGVALVKPLSGSKSRLVQAYLLGVVVPAFVLLSLSIMHKRTGMIFMPALAVWFAMGVSVLSERWSGRLRSIAGVVVWAAVVLNAAQALRVFHFTRKFQQSRSTVTIVIADLLDKSGLPPGKIWAFGAEPEIYGAVRWPIVFPFFQVGEMFDRVYAQSNGSPTDFIRAVRSEGFTYLAVAVAPPEAAHLTLDQVSDRPVPASLDIRRIVPEQSELGLNLVGSADARLGPGVVGSVHVFELRR